MIAECVKKLLTVIENEVVKDKGVVENVNVNPPFVVERDEDTALEETTKSDKRPVVVPIESDTLIVQTTLSPVRDGSVLVHDRLDAVVGLPYTTNVGLPAEIKF